MKGCAQLEKKKDKVMKLGGSKWKEINILTLRYKGTILNISIW
jgi:hypothetical protein